MPSQTDDSLAFVSHSTTLSEIIRLFKEDQKDDWFQDPLLFEDCLDKERIRDYFQKNIEHNHGRFEPVKRVLQNVPKKGGTLRYSLETCFYDRLAYHIFGVPIVESLDGFLHRRVLNHRLDIGRSRGKKRRYLFLNAIEQWKKFKEYVRCDTTDKTVLQTDIQNYYENIRISDLHDTLLKCLKRVNCSYSQKTSLRFCIDSICRCLGAWSYNGHIGLPQNRDISSFLASIHIMPVDEQMISGGYDYYRYMDDISVICSDKYEARAALKRLVGALREIGLNVNSAKTAIIEPGTPEHTELVSGTSYDLDCINAMMSSKRKPLVALALSRVREQLVHLLQNHDFHSREFRFLIRRISKFALCRDISKPPQYFEPITKDIIQAIDSAPEVMDKVYEYLIALDTDSVVTDYLEDFLLDERRSVYSWQNYLVWKLLSFKQHITKPLLARAQAIVHNSKESEATIAGAILFLGMSGETEYRTNLCHIFRDHFKSFFLQRHALIAIQELDYRDVKSTVEEFVLDETRGMYRELHSSDTPRYVVQPPPVAYSDLIREVSSYG